MEKFNTEAQRHGEGVRKVRLGEVCRIIGGGTPSKSKPQYYEGDIPWASVRDMTSRYLSSTEFKITNEAVEKSATNIIPANEVVISTHVGLGKVCILQQDTAINQDLKAILPDLSLDRDYLYFWFVSRAKQIVSAGKGATVKGVTVDFIKNLQIPLPPLPAQREIAGELDRIVGLKKVAAKVQEKLQLLVKSRFVEMFGDPLVADGDERLGDVALLKAGKFVSAHEIKETGKFRCFGGNGVRGYVEKYSHEGFYPIIGRQGALCGNVQLASGKFYATEHAVVVSEIKEWDPHFMYYLLQGLKLGRLAQGVAQPGLAVKNIEEVMVCIPPLSLQREFAAFVEKVEKLEAAAKKAEEKLDLLYRSKLQEYFGE